jgi:hypothetical protein
VFFYCSEFFRAEIYRFQKQEVLNELKKTTNISGIILFFVVILTFFLFNVFTPVAVDDFAYLYSFADGSRITSTLDVIESQRVHYFSQSGRSVAHFFAQIFLMFDHKIIFDIMNTAVYVIFILAVQFHINVRWIRRGWEDLWEFLAINIFLWLFVPAWGQNFLWLTGSCNYLWTTTIVLLFLLPFRIKLEHQNFKFKTILLFFFFPFSVIAGWTNENSGAAVLFMLIVYFVINKINRKRSALFEILGSAGFLIGYLILILAPGNYVRLANFDRKNVFFLVELLGRFVKISAFVLQHYSLVIGLCVLVIWMSCRHQKKKINSSVFFYGIGVLAGSYSLVMSPALSGRSFLMVTVFLSVLFFDLLRSQKIELPAFARNHKSFIVVILLMAFFFSSVLPTSRNIMSVYLRMKQRTEYISRKKSEGILDITVKSPISAHDNHVSIDGLDDIGTSNAAMVKYYGINSLIGALYGEDW